VKIREKSEAFKECCCLTKPAEHIRYFPAKKLYSVCTLIRLPVINRSLVNIRTVPYSGQYTYRTIQWSIYVPTIQWSIYVPHRTVVNIRTVPHSGHYMYSTVFTICTAQWSLYEQHSGHYMYCTVVIICIAQWSLYVLHSGHYMYHQFNIQQFYVLPTQCN
jgi:hypothetical protein